MQQNVKNNPVQMSFLVTSHSFLKLMSHLISWKKNDMLFYCDVGLFIVLSQENDLLFWANVNAQSKRITWQSIQASFAWFLCNNLCFSVAMQSYFLLIGVWYINVWTFLTLIIKLEYVNKSHQDQSHKDKTNALIHMMLNMIVFLGFSFDKLANRKPLIAF